METKSSCHSATWLTHVAHEIMLHAMTLHLQPSLLTAIYCVSCNHVLTLTMSAASAWPDVNGKLSALRTTSMHFVKPGVKVNGHSIPPISPDAETSARYSSASEFYVFQQHSEPTHRARRQLICW